MEQNERLEIMVEDLCEYALDREDIKWIADTLPGQSEISTNKIEYELQLLKIVAVGWSISYYLQEDAEKESILEPFWKNIHDVSGSLSHATSLLTGADINYFQILKSRLDSYVQAMSKARGDNPATVIGPEFAELCGSADNLAASMAGSKMFMAATGGVRQYLLAAGFEI